MIQPVCPRSMTLLAAAVFASLLPLSLSAQSPVQTAPIDPAIARAIASISADNVHADIEKLVSFRNRSTISSMETDLPPGTGVTAAADWIFAEYTHISGACGGCLEVKRDEFVETPPTVDAKDGARVVLAEAPGVQERNAVLFEWLDGTVVDLDDGEAAPGQFETLGAISARMHHHVRGWERPAGFTRP